LTKENGFKYSILASGSTGNVTYIETPERKILVDAGLSGKKIEGLMNEIGRSLRDVDSLLVTHEHKDHIAGLDDVNQLHGAAHMHGSIDGTDFWPGPLDTINGSIDNSGTDAIKWHICHV